MRRRDAAKFNIDNHFVKVKKEREEREAEKLRFSPEHKKNGDEKKQLCETTVAGIAVPVKADRAPKVHFSDFMNDVFAEKRHYAYDAIDK